MNNTTSANIPQSNTTRCLLTYGPDVWDELRKTGWVGTKNDLKPLKVHLFTGLNW